MALAEGLRVTDLLEKLIARTPERSRLPAYVKEAFGYRGRVSASGEFHRIDAIPRRDLDTSADWEAVTTLLHDELRRPGSDECLWPLQVKALHEIVLYGGAFLPLGVGRGKCVSGDTELYDPTCGRRRADDTGVGVVESMLDNGKLVQKEFWSFSSGRKKCVEVKLKDGSVIVLSTDHPIYTPNGWTPAAKLSVDDLVATPRFATPPSTPLSIDDYELELLALLYAEGGFTTGTLMWSNTDPEIRHRLFTLCDRLADASRNINKGWKIEGAVPCCGSHKDVSLRGLSWLKHKWKLVDLAKNKRLPAEFWLLSDRHISLFLNRFWSCDGYIDSAGFGVGLASEGLIDDIRFLLLRLGIHSRKRYKLSRCQTGEFDSWVLTIRGADAIVFQDKIGNLLGQSKRDRQLQVVTKLRAISRNTNTDVVPFGRKELKVVCDELGFSPVGGDPFTRVSGRSRAREFLGATHGQNVSREKFEAFCREFDYQGQYAWLAQTDLRWEKVHSIKQVGVHPVYDLSVPQTGCFVGNNVVLHNTLISLLAPTALQAERPILFVPADLREKTNTVSLLQLRKDWKLHPRLRVIGYSELSLAKNATMLNDLKPDLIIMDEVHALSHRTAGRTRRMLRYLAEHPETKVVAMSGTVTSKSLKNFAHIAEWALRSNCPLPLDWRTLREWADCLDADVPDEMRMHPGALMKWADEEDLTAARDGFRRRLVETPAVVASHADELGTSLVIRPANAPRLSPKTWQMIDDLRRTWKTPNGDDIAEAVDLWRHIRELALGFWLRWDPVAPQDWLEARSEWKQNVRAAIKQPSLHPVDTELQWWNQCAAAGGNLPSTHPWHAWRAIKDSFKINSVAEWVDDGALLACQEWMERSEGGIVWTSHRAFGPRLAELSGRTYHGAGDSSILHTTDQTIIASAAAHGQGKDLQRWSSNLVTAPSASGKAWEQVLGRTHRPGQEADTVTCDVFVHVPELVDAFVKAQAAARYIEETTGNSQKLCYADVLIF